MKTSPNTITFHQDGTISYRLNGRWYQHRKQIPQEDLFSFSKELREKLWTTGYFLGRELVSNVPPVGGMVWPFVQDPFHNPIEQKMVGVVPSDFENNE